MSERWIVVTTIHAPTAALRRVSELCRLEGWRAVVVADVQTPVPWSCPGVDFLSMDEQRHRFGPLARDIPRRHYSRKNLGYLFALEGGAKIIVDLDDDNVPDPAFGRHLSQQIPSGRLLRGPGWTNVYPHFGPNNPGPIWPRGLPLDAIHSAGTISPLPAAADCPIQQFLCDGDPDVDAIYRLTTPGRIGFDRAATPVVLDADCWSPFNSQNTVFFADSFPLLYLPSFVPFRVSDLWRSLVAQAALWHRGQRVGFHAPSVEQQRNPHDLMTDFADEISGYLHNRRLGIALMHRLEALPADEPRIGAVGALWDAMIEIELVPEPERVILDAWLTALERVRRPIGGE